MQAPEAGDGSTPREERSPSPTIEAAKMASLQPKITPRRLVCLQTLGSGAFGDAYLVRNIHGSCMALKRLKRAVRNTDALEEVFGLTSLCSWNTTRMLDSWIDDEQRVNILLEFCDLGNLADYLADKYPLPESEVLSIFAQTLLGLDHLHKKNILHRDIKLANVLLTTSLEGNMPSVKLADFGLVAQMGDSAARAVSHVGTVAFVPPEAAMGYTYSAKSDVWSLGVVLYTVLTNRPPYTSHLVNGMRQLCYTTPSHPCPHSQTYRRALGDCVMAMLQAKWKRRPSVEALLQCSLLTETLRHPPWVGARYAGMMWVVLPRSVAPVILYEACNTRSAILRFLSFGDQVLLSYLPGNGTTEEGNWARVVLPYLGYVCLTDDLTGQMRISAARGFAPIVDELEKW